MSMFGSRRVTTWWEQWVLTLSRVARRTWQFKSTLWLTMYSREECKSQQQLLCFKHSVFVHMHLVWKKDGSLRVCVDHRKTNNDTVPDCIPIPRIDESIDLVGQCGGKVFTTLDLMKWYHQIKSCSEFKEKTKHLHIQYGTFSILEKNAYWTQLMHPPHFRG